MGPVDRNQKYARNLNEGLANSYPKRPCAGTPNRYISGVR